MQKIQVVNIVPGDQSNADQSNETHQDSEPSLAVNPVNPLQMVASAFTPSTDPNDTNAPIYVSTDGGNTWSLKPGVPGGNSKPGNSGTQDMTLCFSSMTNNVYLADLRGDSNRVMEVLSSTFTQIVANPFPSIPSSTTPATSLEKRGPVDQPHIRACTVPTGPDAGKDRIYIGNNDFSALPKSATLDVCLDAAVSNPVFTSVRLEHRTTAGQDSAMVKSAIHPDGTVYSAYYGRRAVTGDFDSNTQLITDADVVLVRDDNWGQGDTTHDPFTALVDSSDNVVGRLVVSGVSCPVQKSGVTEMEGVPPPPSILGQERVQGDISIAVDPGNSSVVYLAWADIQPDSQPSGYTLHLRRSRDRGVTWGPDLLTIPNATNSGLAVTSDGVIGFLYQQLIFVRQIFPDRWETHLQYSPDGLAWHDEVLATTPANDPVLQGDPYLGDFAYLEAVDKTFYGIFCANNTPDPANFPNGVVYQRNHDFQTRTLLGTDGTTQVDPSIDPFFFSVVPDPCAPLVDQINVLENTIVLFSQSVPEPDRSRFIAELERQLVVLRKRACTSVARCILIRHRVGGWGAARPPKRAARLHPCENLR